MHNPQHGTANKWGLPYKDSWQDRHVGGTGIPDWMREPASGGMEQGSTSLHQAENEAFRMKNLPVSGGNQNTFSSGPQYDPSTLKMVSQDSGVASRTVYSSEGYPEQDHMTTGARGGATGYMELPERNVQMAHQSPQISNVKMAYHSGADPNLRPGLPKPTRPDVGSSYGPEYDPMDYNMATSSPDQFANKNIANLKPGDPFTPPPSFAGSSVGNQKVGTNAAAQATQGATGGGTAAAAGASKIAKGAKFLGNALELATPIISYAQEKDALDSATAGVEDMISNVEGSLQGMPNKREAYQDSSNVRFSETRRQLGAAQKDSLLASLETIRNKPRGGLTSGTVKETAEGLTDAAGTQVGVSIGRAYDEKIKEDSAFASAHTQERAQFNQTLSELKVQQDELNKKSKWLAVDKLTDFAIGVVSVINPAAGMGLKVGKSMITGGK